MATWQSIPNEADLAIELGCAHCIEPGASLLPRSVCRADVAEAGTRVALHPISKATLSIPLIRNEIEANGKLYGYVA